jgi:hypothetical protein
MTGWLSRPRMMNQNVAGIVLADVMVVLIDFVKGIRTVE